MKNDLTISRRTLLKLSGSISLGTILPALPAIAGNKTPVIVELFTSQGCSSCPPADALMEELGRMPGVVALSFNVDYWDYLGWRDTLGSPEHSKRQRQYARNGNMRGVYTPQMIINGYRDVVGSRRNSVLAALREEAGRKQRPMVPVTMYETADELVVEVGAAPKGMQQHKATLWIAMTSRKVEVNISRGENSGRRIVYHNAVRQLIPAGMWHGKAMRIALPLRELFAKGKRDCVALLQQGSIGPILGVATIGGIGG